MKARDKKKIEGSEFCLPCVWSVEGGLTIVSLKSCTVAAFFIANEKFILN